MFLFVTLAWTQASQTHTDAKFKPFLVSSVVLDNTTPRLRRVWWRVFNWNKLTEIKPNDSSLTYLNLVSVKLQCSSFHHEQMSQKPALWNKLMRSEVTLKRREDFFFQQWIDVDCVTTFRRNTRMTPVWKRWCFAAWEERQYSQARTANATQATNTKMS